MKSIQLKRLSDSFEHEGDLIFDNAQVTVTTIQNVINILVNAGWIDNLPINSINKNTATLDNRSYRLWRLNIVENMAKIINQLTAVLNEQGLLLPPDYEELGNIDLYLPVNLSFDESYQQRMNQNFELIEDRINNFYIMLNDAGFDL